MPSIRFSGSMLLVSLLLLSTACATSSATDRDARRLALSIAEAIEGSPDCAALGARLDAALAGQEARITSIANSTEDPTKGGPSLGEQERLQAVATRAKQCVGAAPGLAAERALAPLSKFTKSTPSASNAVDCANDCCVEGFQTWAEVSFYSVACVGGSNFACCMATTIASYNACMNTYCPTNDCCQGVPVSVPPGGPSTGGR